MTICDRCQKEIRIGEHPFCPHGFASANVIDDTLPGGGRYLHNVSDQPVWCSTKSEYKKLLKAHGLEQRERSTYNRDDKSPWATESRLRPGQRDPFVHRADFNR